MTWLLGEQMAISAVACLHNDVVDGDVDQLDEEANEAHHREANGSGNGDLLQLCVSHVRDE